MKDAEQIYALYVQANPVPNPDLLPLTGDEAVLLSIEGSQAMQTQEPTKEQPTARTTGRNILVAAGAFAVVIVIGLIAALLVNSGDSGPVAAADAAPVAVFDGTTCSYEGPTEIEEGTVEFSIANSGNVDFTLAGWLMAGAALEKELQLLPVSSDMKATDFDPVPDGHLVFGFYTRPGDPKLRAWPLSAGTYLIDCKTEDHVWRAAQVEVVVP
ncbi:MAG: hypothetical protein WBN35_10065 [Acidimicrobiia bacterium]